MNVVINIYGEKQPKPHSTGFEQRVEESLKELHRKVDLSMSVTKQQFDELREAFNAETDALAARIEAAINAAKSNGGLTGPEGDAVFADLAAVRDRLKTLGADASNPIPAPVDNNPPVGGTIG